MINTMEESEHEEEEEPEDEIAVSVIFLKIFIIFKILNFDPFQKSLSPNFQKELADDAWIQCEREECLKWRRVNNEIAEKYENENWYCELNPDKNYNRYDFTIFLSVLSPSDTFHVVEKLCIVL